MLDLLRIPEKQLVDALVNKQLVVVNSVTMTKLNYEQAEHARDTFATVRYDFAHVN